MRNKYNSKSIVIDGEKFDSMMEADRYLELSLMQRAGIISNLECHPTFTLQEPFSCDGKRYQSIKYTPDFRYEEGGRIVVEEVKGYKTKDYSIRKRLFLYQYGERVLFKEIL